MKLSGLLLILLDFYLTIKIFVVKHTRMNIGHFGNGFAAKKKAPGVSLGLLFIAAQFLDLLWPSLLLLGAEHVVPDAAG